MRRIGRGFRQGAGEIGKAQRRNETRLPEPPGSRPGRIRDLLGEGQPLVPHIQIDRLEFLVGLVRELLGLLGQGKAALYTFSWDHPIPLLSIELHDAIL